MSEHLQQHIRKETRINIIINVAPNGGLAAAVVGGAIRLGLQPALANAVTKT